MTDGQFGGGGFKYFLGAPTVLDSTLDIAPHPHLKDVTILLRLGASSARPIPRGDS